MLCSWYKINYIWNYTTKQDRNDQKHKDIYFGEWHWNDSWNTGLRHIKSGFQFLLVFSYLIGFAYFFKFYLSRWKVNGHLFTVVFLSFTSENAYKAQVIWHNII